MASLRSLTCILQVKSLKEDAYALHILLKETGANMPFLSFNCMWNDSRNLKLANTQWIVIKHIHGYVDEKTEAERCGLPKISIF